MFKIRVEADFSAAHFLQDYHGKCENLHGHNYKIYAYAKGKKLDNGGMLLDFGILKNALRKICTELDHTNLNDIHLFEQNPSAERIAKYIFDKLYLELENSDKINNTTDKEKLYRIDVFETETSRASYCIE
ncbi:MAG: 6-carboxytetrahydropterin synthase QueD [Treponemataceae bacterium]